MTTTTYEGWTNWETWNMNLWIMNEQPSYEFAREQWKRLHEMPDQTLIDYTVAAKQVCMALYRHGTPDFGGIHELDAVNWSEIAENWHEMLD